MSDQSGTGSAITPFGLYGVPITLGLGGPWAGTGWTHYFQNPQQASMVVTHIDCTETAPGSGDWLRLSWYTSTQLYPFFGTTVGAGHSGAFSDHWDGLLVLGFNNRITVEGTAGGSSTWFVVVQGYYCISAPAPTMSVS